MSTRKIGKEGLSMSTRQSERLQLDEAIKVAIAVGIWIYERKELIGRTFAEVTKGVTNIKQWKNATDQEVEVFKVDGGLRKKDHYRIPPGQTVNADMWIPWADNAAQYRDHHATILVGGRPLAYIWQSGPAIRFNTSDKFVPGGQPVPGFSKAGGDRMMAIARDPQGRIGFAVGGYKG